MGTWKTHPIYPDQFASEEPVRDLKNVGTIWAKLGEPMWEKLMGNGQISYLLKTRQDIFETINI